MSKEIITMNIVGLCTSIIISHKAQLVSIDEPINQSDQYFDIYMFGFLLCLIVGLNLVHICSQSIISLDRSYKTNNILDIEPNLLTDLIIDGDTEEILDLLDNYNFPKDTLREIYKWALVYGNIQIVRSLMLNSKISEYTIGSEMANHALQIASYFGHGYIVEFLIRQEELNKYKLNYSDGLVALYADKNKKLCDTHKYIEKILKDNGGIAQPMDYSQTPPHNNLYTLLDCPCKH